MMSKQLSRRAAGVLALGVVLVTMGVFRGYGAADDRVAAAPSQARCDARPAGGATVLAQIRYDSGLVLRYCGLQTMFAQLGAQEQPGLVRAVHVLTSDGGWVDARHARYVRGRGGVALAYAQAVAAGGATVSSYSQLLRACARGDCGA
ncbi:MAG TPA: hypothetical protein VN089_14300 [Duganella sp.]|nr:hypothetical protein [Duganella sp.]